MSRLDAIAARLEAATPGPWQAVTDNDGRTKEHAVWSERFLIAECIQTKPDADLIAHAPADLAVLLAVVREVAALADSLDNPTGPLNGADRLTFNVVARKIRRAIVPLTEEETDGS